MPKAVNMYIIEAKSRDIIWDSLCIFLHAKITICDYRTNRIILEKLWSPNPVLLAVRFRRHTGVLLKGLSEVAL